MYSTVCTKCYSVMSIRENPTCCAWWMTFCEDTFTLYFVLMVLEYTLLHFTQTQTQHKLFMLGLGFVFTNRLYLTSDTS